MGKFDFNAESWVARMTTFMLLAGREIVVGAVQYYLGDISNCPLSKKKVAEAEGPDRPSLIGSVGMSPSV